MLIRKDTLPVFLLFFSRSAYKNYPNTNLSSQVSLGHLGMVGFVGFLKYLIVESKIAWPKIETIFFFYFFSIKKKKKTLNSYPKPSLFIYTNIISKIWSLTSIITSLLLSYISVAFQSMSIHFSTLQSSLVLFDQLWCTLVQFSLFGLFRFSVQFGPFRSI